MTDGHHGRDRNGDRPPEEGGRQRGVDDGNGSTGRVAADAGRSGSAGRDVAFYRSLPVFDSRDRQTVQSLLHYAVATDDEDVDDVAYDHPDRKVARDIYHQLREGDAIRLLIGSDLRGVGLVVSYAGHDLDVETVLGTFERICAEAGHEWPAVARDLRTYRRDHLDPATAEIGFEYRY